MERKVQIIYIYGLPLEYSIIGEGEPILILHGGHSNCYEEFGYKALLEQGFSLITPSRPGYGRTAKAAGETLATSCQYYEKLLNHLGINKVHIIAASAAGPSGLLFAATYKERVKTLVLQSAITKEWLTPQDKQYRIAHVLFRPVIEKFTWKLISLMNDMFPTYMFKQMAPSFSKLSLNNINIKVKENDREEVRKMNKRYRSGSGFLLDLEVMNELTTENLGQISCPTLIMQSENDILVSIDHAYHASEQIANSELLLLDTWGHLIWLGEGAEHGDKKLCEFLHTHF